MRSGPVIGQLSCSVSVLTPSAIGDLILALSARMRSPVPQTPATGQRTSGTEWKHGVNNETTYNARRGDNGTADLILALVQH